MVKEIELADERVVEDLDTLRLLADPLRLRLLAAFYDRARSVKEAAARLGLPPAKLYYHVELLERHGLIAIASTRVVSGITEKHYRATARNFRVDRRLLALADSDAAIDSYLAAVLDVTRAEAERSACAGAFNPGSDYTVLARNVVRLSPDRLAAFKAEIDALLSRFQSASADGADLPAQNITIAYFPLMELD